MFLLTLELTHKNGRIAICASALCFSSPLKAEWPLSNIIIYKKFIFYVCLFHLFKSFPFPQDLFLAGVGTSAEVTLWTLAELINNPDVFNKVREEIKYVVGNTRLVEESDVPSLPYLQAVIKEALRLHPALPVVVRECREACKIKDFDVPKKTMVAVNLYAIIRDEKIWDYPNDFRPERFLVSSKGKDGMEHIPFGAGRRGCPGEKLAFSMIQIVVAAMVQCFDWKVGREGDNVKVNMQVGPGITKPMAQPLICLPIVHFNPFTSSK